MVKPGNERPIADFIRVEWLNESRDIHVFFLSLFHAFFSIRFFIRCLCVRFAHIKK